jgi:hypothetical protein
MAVNIGLGERTYQKTEVFDTAGNHTWTHPLPGQNIEVFVEAFGGGGGSQTTSGVATDGGDTIWDTASEALVIDGGSGGNAGTSKHGWNIVGGKGLLPEITDNYNPGNLTLLTNGNNHYGAVIRSNFTGNLGDVKRFNRVVTNDINFTIGAGGTGNVGNGTSGAIIISYNITTTQTPVVVNMQRRDWEHFGEVAWSPVASAADQSVTIDTLTTLNIDTEVLDTGNKVGTPSANQFTLEAGTYEFDFSVPVANGGGAGNIVLRVYNVSDSSVLSSELMPYENIINPVQSNGIFTLSSSKIVRLEFAYSDGTKSVGTASGGIEFSSFNDATPRTRFKFKWRP